MTGHVIDGKAVAQKVHQELEREVREVTEGLGRPPGLGVLLVGHDPASRVYVTSKRKACAKLGIHSDEIALGADASMGEVLGALNRLNRDDKIDGILVQLPLPSQIDTHAVLEAMDPAKDADVFHPFNVGKLYLGQGTLYPCTPLGCMRLLDAVDFDPKGKRAVVVGRSNIVGKPMAAMLMARHATVTVCHSRTVDLATEVSRADVVIAAAGCPNLIRGAWIKPGAVVIDVGVNRVGDKLVGDVEFEAARARASHITPVPGGVGPVTIAMLLHNTVKLARRRMAGVH